MKPSRRRCCALVLALAGGLDRANAECSGFLREESSDSRILFVSEPCLQALSSWDGAEGVQLRLRFPELEALGEPDVLYLWLANLTRRSSATVEDLAAGRCRRDPDSHGTVPPGYSKPIGELIGAAPERLVVEVTNVTNGLSYPRGKISSLVEFRIVERLGARLQSDNPVTGKFLKPHGFLVAGGGVACEAPAFGRSMARPGDRFLLLGRWSNENPGVLYHHVDLPIEEGKIRVKGCGLCSSGPDLSLEQAREASMPTP